MGAWTGHRLASLGVRLWLAFYRSTVIFSLKLICLSLWEKFAKLSASNAFIQVFMTVQEVSGWPRAEELFSFFPSGDGGRHF